MQPLPDVQGGAQPATQQERQQSALPQPSGQAAQPSVPPPRRCAWHQDHVNSIKLIGLVEGQPQTRRLPDGGVVASLSLGLLPRLSASASPKRAWVLVEFLGHEALQVAQHVGEGTQLAVGGQLLPDPTSGLKVLAEYMQVVEPGAGVLVSSAATAARPRRAARPPKTQPPRVARRANATQPTGPLKRPAAWAQAMHDVWLAQPELSWADLAASFGADGKRVMDGLANCACAGLPTDLTRLAAQLQICHPQLDGAPWLTVPELHAAIGQARAAAEEGGLLRLAVAREALLAQPRTAAKLQSQEAAVDLGVALTFAQLRLALADLDRGLGLAAAVTGVPSELRQLLAPTAASDPPAADGLS